MPELRPDPPARPRGPWDVPDDPDPWRPQIGGHPDGVDTDDDGVPDTVVLDDGADVLVATDLDGDGVADQVLRLTAEGSVRTVELPDTAPETTGWPPLPH